MGFSPSFFMGLGQDFFVEVGRERFENPLPCHPLPCTTCLHILLAHPCLYYYLLSLQYAVLHILFYCTFYSLFFLYFFLPTLMYILLCCVTYNCTVH